MTIHITPHADMVDHERGDECVCGPSHEPVELPDGSVGWVAIHHALDSVKRPEASVGRAIARHMLMAEWRRR